MANLLTLLRLCATPFVVWLMYADSATARYGALALFIGAMLTDVFDGMLARRGGQTVLGNYLDPVADKTLILCVFVCLGERGVLPLWMGLVLIGRELFVSGVRNVGAAQGRIVSANWMGKTKTFLQVVTISFGLLLLARAGNTMPDDSRLSAAYRSLWALGFVTVTLSVVFAIAFLYRSRDLLLGRESRTS